MTSISVLTSLYNCKEYLDRFFYNAEKITNLDEVEFIFIHNDSTEKEKEIIDNFLKLNKINYQYVEVPREGLYKSWNRGIQLAHGKYIAIWNVDDIRFPDSFILQRDILDRHIDVALTYGNYHITRKYGEVGERIINTIDINKETWFKKFQGGCFLMWRKSIHESIGYFDEQFVSLGDQDFWYRVIEKYKVKRSEGSLGSFLAEPNKGISKSSNIPLYEKNIIGLRYGFFTYINFWGWCKALNLYSPTKITYGSEPEKIDRKILKYQDIRVYLYSMLIIIISIFKKKK